MRFAVHAERLNGVGAALSHARSALPVPCGDCEDCGSAVVGAAVAENLAASAEMWRVVDDALRSLAHAIELAVESYDRAEATAKAELERVDGARESP